MSPGTSRRRLAVLGLAVSAFLAGAGLNAQTSPSTEPDTIYFGQRQQTEMPKFWIAPMRGYVDLRMTHTESRVASSGPDNNSEVTETLFQETLTLYSSGYVVHPNIVDFRFSVTGGLSQDFINTDTGSDSTTGTVVGWDVSAIFFRTQPGNLTLYSRRTEGTVDVPFGPTQKTTTMVTGALWNYHTVDSSLQLEAYRQEETQSTFGSRSDENDFAETRDVFRGDGDTQLSENQTLNWHFDLEQSTYESAGSTSDEQSAAGSVGHVASFGEGNRSSLSSSVALSIGRGNLDREDLRWNEHLHLYHSPNFETNYDYTYQKLTYGNSTTDRQAAYVDARHQLYKSLTTIGRLRWENVDSGKTSTTTYAGDLSANYRKNTPDGILFIDSSVGRQIQEISGSGSVFVIDQSATFVGLDPITVSQVNAVPSTLLIRDAVSGRTYIQGIDYTVTQTPVGLEINRVLGGNILPGQALLMSYNYDPLDATEVTTDTFTIGTRYEFTKGPLDGISPFARFSAQDQTTTGGTARPNSVRDYLVGVDYHYDGLTLSAEREILDSTLYPYEAWRYEARYNHRLSSQTSFSMSATYSDIQYHKPDQRTKDASLSASLSQQFSTELSASIYGAVVTVDSSLGGQTTGLEQGLQMNWNHRDTKVYMRVRNSTLDSETTERNFQFLQIGLIRNF